MDTSRFGEYDSWVIVNDDIAWKHCDKSFFEHRMSGILTEIRWFFKIEHFNPGEKQDIILVYNKINYIGTLQRIRMPPGRTRITWETSLKSQFDPYSKDGKPHTLAFKRVGENKYGIRFIDSDQHVDIGNDATHSDFNVNAQEFTEDSTIAESISLQELEGIAAERSNRDVIQREVATTQYYRDPFISELAKRNANGKCQLCQQPAPFFDKNDKPYLETHHVRWLSKGGADSVNNTVAELVATSNILMQRFLLRQLRNVSSRSSKERTVCCAENQEKRENKRNHHFSSCIIVFYLSQITPAFHTA